MVNKDASASHNLPGQKIRVMSNSHFKKAFK